jgi:hypothetical protein
MVGAILSLGSVYGTRPAKYRETRSDTALRCGAKEAPDGPALAPSVLVS